MDKEQSVDPQRIEDAGRKLRAMIADQQSLWAQTDAFSRSVHESLDLGLTAYSIANEGRRLIGCDRLSVAICKGKKCVIRAVSGQDTFDARSNTVVLLGRLASTVVATGDPLWYTGESVDLPPQIEKVVQEYVNESLSKTIAVLPLHKPRSEMDSLDNDSDDESSEREVIGALIVEQIEDTLPYEVLSQRVERVKQHSARALANTLQYNNLFLMPLWRFLGKARWLVRARTLPKTLTITAVILLAFLAAFIIPSDFDMEAGGILQPTTQRDVFVDTPGVVTAVHVKHGDPVEQGTPLVDLRNTDLEEQLADLVGRKETVLKQKHSVERALLEENELSAENRNRLSAQLSQLKQRLVSLEKQHELLKEKHKQLHITSPIDGQVVTWDIEQLLFRPVTTGQVLLTVANPDGDWELEVYMPEKRMGHVERAWKSKPTDKPLKVTYIMQTDPGTSHQGTVEEIHVTSSLHEDRGQSVRIRVKIDKNDLTDRRPGATATAKIHCGQRSIAYVWMHEAIEFIQSRILF